MKLVTMTLCIVGILTPVSSLYTLRGAKPSNQYKDTPVIRAAKPSDQYKDTPVIRVQNQLINTKTHQLFVQLNQPINTRHTSYSCS